VKVYILCLYRSSWQKWSSCRLGFLFAKSLKSSSFGAVVMQPGNSHPTHNHSFSSSGVDQTQPSDIIEFKSHSKKCWVISTQSWVKYGQTQMLG